MSIPEIITTARLRLRPPELRDAPAVLREYATDEAVTRFLLWRPHESLTDTEGFLSYAVGGWSMTAPSELTWVLERLEDGEDPTLLGMIAARGMFPGGHAVEVGYVLARRWWGQGITSEAARALVDTLLDAGFWRVWASCHVDNPASARVLERAGMQREGTLRRLMVFPNLSDEPQDCHMYAKVRAS